MSKRIAAAIVCVILVVLIAISIIFPSSFYAAVHLANRVLNKSRSVLPIIPLLLYAILLFVIRSFLGKVPRNEIVIALDRQEASSLALSGFCFTSLNLLIAFFKDEIKRGDAAPEGILFFFAVALGSFIASYMVLRYRTRNLYMILNEALIDNGLWCVLVGFWAFFNASPTLRDLTSVFTIFIVVCFAYLTIHFGYWIKFARTVT